MVSVWHPFWSSGSLSKGSHVLVQGSKVSSGTFSMFLFEILWLLFVRIPFGGWNVLKNPKICTRTQNDCWLIYILADFIETLTKWPTHVTDILAKSHQNLRKISKNSSFRSIFTWFWSIFFSNSSEKRGQTNSRGVRVLWAHSGASKLEKQSKINVFWSFFARFSHFVAPEWAQSTLTPRNQFAHVFLMNLKKNGPTSCTNWRFSNKSTFLGRPKILNQNSRRVEVRYVS